MLTAARQSHVQLLLELRVPMLELKLLLPYAQLLVPHLLPGDVAHDLQPLLDQALVVGAQVLDVLLQRFAFAPELLLDLDAPRLQVLDLDLDLLLLSLYLLSNSQSETCGREKAV